jgi:tRNA pseudouridine65 synthase
MARAPLPVLDEGEGWLIVGKPARLITHKNAQSADRLAALQWVRDQLGKRVQPIHRLDRPASGCLLFSTDDRAADLQACLGAPEARKEYVALVRGCIPVGAETTIDRPLDGRPSRTELLVLGSMPEPRCSLVLARLHSGRFHQIRRHLAGIGNPILGDSRHGDTRVNRWWREHHGLPRLMLHAWGLAFQAPDRPADARCPLWPDMAKVLRALPLWEQAVAARPALVDDFEVLPPWAFGPPPGYDPGDAERPEDWRAAGEDD